MVVGLAALIIALIIITPKSAPPVYSKDEMSVGYMRKGNCMSLSDFERRAAFVMENNHWPKGERTLTGTAGFIVAGEMKRLGTKACPDLDFFYQDYLKATTSVKQ